MDTGVFEYIKWRGDLSFKVSAFNEIDALIFCELSYLHLKGIVPSDFSSKGIPLHKVVELFFSAEDFSSRSDTGLFFNKNLLDLLKAVGEVPRYKDVSLIGFVESTDLVQEKQFAAFTTKLDDGSFFVAYRGTDDSIIGWKEDFNMVFVTPVPAQTEALNYLIQASKLKGKIRIGGHSKGGNLSVYAATYCPSSIQKRIIEVYNNDGPGFEYNITELKEFRPICDKVHTFVPQDSIVGMLLEHDEDYVIVQSVENGLMQHDPFSWQVCGTNFILLDKVSKQSVFIDHAIKDWLKGMDKDHREQFVDALYDLLTSSEASTFSELSEKWTKNPIAAVRSLLALNEETRSIVWNSIQQLFRSARTQIPSITDLFNKQT